MSEPRGLEARLAVGLAAMLAVPVGLGTYAVERVVEWSTSPSANPASIVRMSHMPYFFRLSLAAYAAGSAACVAYARWRDAAPTVAPAVIAAWLTRACAAAALAFAVTSWLVP